MTKLKIGDRVRLRNGVDGFGVSSDREDNRSAVITAFLADVKGGIKTDRDLRGCKYWNVLDVQKCVSAKTAVKGRKSAI